MGSLTQDLRYLVYRRLSPDSSSLFEFVGQLETTRALERSGHVERIPTVAVAGRSLVFSNKEDAFIRRHERSERAQNREFNANA